MRPYLLPPQEQSVILLRSTHAAVDLLAAAAAIPGIKDQTEGAVRLRGQGLRIDVLGTRRGGTCRGRLVGRVASMDIPPCTAMRSHVFVLCAATHNLAITCSVGVGLAGVGAIRRGLPDEGGQTMYTLCTPNATSAAIG